MPNFLATLSAAERGEVNELELSMPYVRYVDIHQLDSQKQSDQVSCMPVESHAV
jgi:hypothetical protein